MGKGLYLNNSENITVRVAIRVIPSLFLYIPKLQAYLKFQTGSLDKLL